MFPERFSNLPEYAFPRLRALLDGHRPGGDVVHMSIGEPRHPFPDWITDIITRAAEGFGRYPPNAGTFGLRTSIADWLRKRYSVIVDPDSEVMVLNGTREGLYNACMALVPEAVRGEQPLVLMPNPFYQVYMVGAISVGARPVLAPATRASGYLPDYAGLPTDMLNRTAAAYVCSPSNPQGAVASRHYLRELITLAEEFDFKIFSDECYSEIYRENAPPGALEVAGEMCADPERVVMFNSLSKRSNLPGLRSGFVAGGPETLARMNQLRTYAGAPLPIPLQEAAEAVWRDEDHVVENRDLYQDKYEVVDEIFSGVPEYSPPEAGFFLWLPVEDGEAAALKIWRETGVRVLPGAYLARDVAGENPGRGYIRVALVAPMTEMQNGLIQLRDCIYK